jgi:hypothetical protein
VWGCALAAVLTGPRPAEAAWNNVFQVCCASCRSAPVVAAYPADPCCAPACPAPCPQTTCTTRYVQRCYYQPVTTYRTNTYYEPVTTYRTSYYYEACTSYRYSCYYDPCTCSYQQVAQPVTSYQLRSRCCPVTSYLQRCCLQPVTSYRAVTYYEPVTTCCTTTSGAPVCAPPAGATVVPATPPPAGAAPPPAVPPAAPAPGVTEERGPPPPAPPPAVDERRDLGGPASDSRRLDRSPALPHGAGPRGSEGSSYRPPQLRGPVPITPRTVEPPRVRYDRIASRAGATLQGRILTPERRPSPGARVLFVSAERRGQQQVVTADRAGQFHANLGDGRWLVYVHDGAGRPIFARRIDVSARRPQALTLVGR